MFRRFMAAGLAVFALTQANPVAAQTTIRIASSSESLAYIPVYAADALGYFKQMGITLNRTIVAGPSAIAAVASGNLDVVMGATANPVLANKSGADVLIVGSMTRQFGPGIVVSKKWTESHKLTAQSSTKDKMAALKGISISVQQAGGGSDQLLRLIAEEGGLVYDRDMTVTSIPDQQAQIAAITNGRVDAIVTTPPYSNMTARALGGLLMLNSGLGEIESLDGYLGSAISVRGSWAKPNEALLVNFLKAVQMGFDVMQDPVRTNQARDLVRAQIFKDIEPDMFAEVWDASRIAAPKSLLIAQKQVDIFMAVNNRFSKDKLDLATMQKAYTNEYAEKALKK